MEYTDCDNCLRLEAENADLEEQVSDCEEEIIHLKSIIENALGVLEDV